jgi:oxalate decarboxylase/phosphoglucose isomerase-like protein (cupin superfamily)
MFNKLRILLQERHEDARGFVQKILTETQCNRFPVRGEIYATAALPGEVKGNHFHRFMGEWFSVIQGHGSLELCIPESGQRQSVPLNAEKPCTIYVPAGLAHAVVNSGDSVLICIAAAEAEHDPKDALPFKVWPPES